eukprot:TRINITY_DN82_c0_g2_i3.p1 TRINITY_DN82_c0_g2~~TRINITY_DN82_c0_g2_i3.p1  ORF type:complete len:572 (-),score=147.01 TRINITY_DN82_c0_g2_i3:452-2167(-)
MSGGRSEAVGGGDDQVTESEIEMSLAEALRRSQAENKELQKHAGEVAEALRLANARLVALEDASRLKNELLKRALAAQKQQAACVQDILRAIPPHAVNLLSGKRLLVRSAAAAAATTGVDQAVDVNFSRAFAAEPTVLCWLTTPGETRRLAPALLRPAPSGFTVAPQHWEDGSTLHWMAFTARQSEHVAGIIGRVEALPPTLPPHLEGEIAELCDAGLLEECDSQGNTLVHAACTAGNAPLLRWLLARRAPLDIGNNQGYTPLVCAVAAGHFRLASELLDKGADPNVTVVGGTTVLHLMCKHKQTVVDESSKWFCCLFDTLLARGLNPKAVSASGSTCLLTACLVGNRTAAVKLLATGNVNANTINQQGFSPLHCAVHSRDLALVDMLLANGGDPYCSTAVGIPAQMARDLGFSIDDTINRHQAADIMRRFSYPLLKDILSQLEPCDLFRCRRVCRTFVSAVDEVATWPAYWRSFNTTQAAYITRHTKYHCQLDQFRLQEIPQEHDFFFKIRVVGDRGTGKSSFLRRFEEDSFTDQQIPLPEDSKIVPTVVNQKVVKLQLWDSPEERFRVM